MSAALALVLALHVAAQATLPVRALPQANECSLMAAVPEGWRDPRTGCVYHAGTLTPTCHANGG